MVRRAVLLSAGLPLIALGEAANLTRSADQHLQIVDAYLARTPRSQTGLLQTYGPNSFGGGDCGDEYCKLVEPCPAYSIIPHCRFDVYDNALAATYLIQRGQLPEAKKILDAFVYYLYPGDSIPYEFYPYAYVANSGRHMTLMAASYTDEKSKPGMYQGAGVADGATDIGNHAFVGMAFARYAAKTGDSCMSTVAHDIIGVLSEVFGCDDALGGFMGRAEPFVGNYRSMEHNIDMFAFAQALGKSDIMNQARKFTQSMYGKSSQGTGWGVGTGGKRKCDSDIASGQPICIDAQMWNVAAGADSDSGRASAALDFAMKTPIKPDGDWSKAEARKLGLFESNTDYIGHNGKGIGEVYYGFRFTNWGNGIQWENAAAGLVALTRFRSEHGSSADVPDRIVKVRNSIKKLLEIYGSVPASIYGGNLKRYEEVRQWEKFPGGSDTGLSWSYFRYPHLASTVWSGLALMQQGDEGEAIQAEANPYAPPSQAIPSGGSTTCLPAESNTPQPTPQPTPAPVPTPVPVPTPAPVPTPVPTPSPSATCNVGDNVVCPGGVGRCAGGQCCPGGITCPSAAASFHGCPNGKTEDCTGQGLEVVV